MGPCRARAPGSRLDLTLTAVQQVLQICAPGSRGRGAAGQGGELRSNYGHKSDEELLAGYGFALGPANRADFFHIALRLGAGAAGAPRACAAPHGPCGGCPFAARAHSFNIALRLRAGVPGAPRGRAAPHGPCGGLALRARAQPRMQHMPQFRSRRCYVTGDRLCRCMNRP